VSHTSKKKKCDTRVLLELKQGKLKYVWYILTFRSIRSQRINSEKGCYKFNGHVTFILWAKAATYLVYLLL